MADLKKILAISCCIICIIGIILAIALSVASLESLEPTEVGLAYDTVSVSLDETQLYKGGRHFIGVSKNFIIYKTQLQPLSFNDVDCRTKDGLSLQLDLSFQYRLREDLTELVNLNYQFPWASYDQGYLRIARNVFRDAVAKFTAFDFVYNRTNVEVTLKEDLKQDLLRYSGIVENFQLLDITYPKEFSEAISETQNANLTIQSAIFNQTKIKNEADGQIRRAQTEADVIINQANAQSNTFLEQAKGKALAIKERVSRQIESLKSIKDGMGIKDSKSLIAYQWLNTLRVIESSVDSSKIIVEYPIPSMLQKL